MEQKNEFERLPKSVIPSHYNLTLEPDLVACVFSGSEQIDVEVKCSTSTIKMNAVCINVKSTSWKSATQEFSDVTVTYDIDNETVSFIFPEELQEGKGTLSIAFTGELNDLMKGFYRSKYKTPSGEERICATTQFEATDARRAFPCWDEPAIKASFDITLIVPKDRVALSNMPVKKESDVEGKPDKHRVEFDRSPIMSTYLLAFIVGEYDYVEDTDSDGVRVRVYTPQGKKEQGRFALEVATKTLPFYHKYFNVPYPLPKVDLIAIADFAAGAMENWGLVTYRETAVLVDEENSSAANKQRVALVVGHELAHQWFGNLVTMEWWTHLWLNEGFASFIEYLCVDNLFPDYDIWTQFAVQDYCVALKIDALQNSHPIEVPVGNPDEIDEIFDTISYCKGASVIRMLHNFLGDKDFRAGMKVYLDRHKYTNTFTEDLWAALGETSGKPVAKIMNTWTKQMGFPVLEVDEVEEGNKRTLTITQTKFCADGNTDDTSLWMVPVNICSASSSAEPIHSFVLEDKSTTVTLDNVKPGEWIKLNVGGVGFYRTRYSTSMLDRLVAAVKDKSMPPRDRLSLQNDLFAMARAGITSMVDALKVAEAFINEDNYTVWSNLTSNLGALSVILQYTDYYDQLKAFLRQLFSRTAKEVGWDAKPGEGHLKALLRSLMINRMGLCDDAETIAEAKKRFTAHADGSKQLPADLRAPVYSIVLSSGGEETYNQVLEIFRKTDLNEEKVRILRSLGAAKDAKLIARTLKFALDDEVRSQDKIYAVIGTTGSVEGREQAWKFVQEHWKELNALYTGGFLFARIIQYTTEDFVTQEKYDEIEAFFKEHPAPAAERTIKQSLENITLSRSLLERDCDAMRDFLCQ